MESQILSEDEAKNQARELFGFSADAWWDPQDELWVVKYGPGIYQICWSQYQYEALHEAIEKWKEWNKCTPYTP